MSLRSFDEDENGGSVGCGESANRIERMRATTDAVPVGHRILQTDARIGHELKFKNEEGAGRCRLPPLLIVSFQKKIMTGRCVATL